MSQIVSVVAVIIEIVSGNVSVSMVKSIASTVRLIVRAAITILILYISTQTSIGHNLPQPKPPKIESGDPKLYVQIHNWTDRAIPNEILHVMRKPLRYRPTCVEKQLFIDDMENLSTRIANKWDVEGRALFQEHRRDLSVSSQIASKYKKAIRTVKANLQGYVDRLIARPIRNRNITKRQIDRLKTIHHRHPDLVVLPADKGRGNVMILRSWWLQFNDRYLAANDANFRVIRHRTKENLIEHALSDTKNLLNKYKYLFVDRARALSEIEQGKYSRLGRWAPIPKVHKTHADGTC